MRKRENKKEKENSGANNNNSYEKNCENLCANRKNAEFYVIIYMTNSLCVCDEHVQEDLCHTVVVGNTRTHR